MNDALAPELKGEQWDVELGHLICFWVILCSFPVVGRSSTPHFWPFNCCSGVVLQLEKRDYPKNSHVAFCPNKQRSFELFRYFHLTLERQQSFSVVAFLFLFSVAKLAFLCPYRRTKYVCLRRRCLSMCSMFNYISLMAPLWLLLHGLVPNNT